MSDTSPQPVDEREAARRNALMRAQFSKFSDRWERAMSADEALKMLSERTSNVTTATPDTGDTA